MADGLEASVVTMNQANDIAMLAERGLVAADWAKKFPHGAAPFYSTMVFLVRKGNPKQIKDWANLAKPGVKVVSRAATTTFTQRDIGDALVTFENEVQRSRSPCSRWMKSSAAGSKPKEAL